MARPDTDHLIAETQAERGRLAALMEAFTPEQWATPSLCDGWRVREVLAHMTMPFRTTTLRFFLGFARARFSFPRYADADARSCTRTTGDAELLELYRRNIAHPWQPPGGGSAGALGHDVIHGLDITEPLGLPAPPPSRIAAVLNSGGPKNLEFFGVDLTGTRLEADDAELAIGEGATRRMPAKDVLLVVTGRRALADIPDERS